METNSNKETNANEDKNEPALQKVDNKQETKRKYLRINVYHDNDANADRAVVYFADGEAVPFYPEYDTLRLFNTMDDESAPRFREDISVLHSSGKFDNLLHPEQDQPNPQNVGKEQEVIKVLGYSHIELHTGNGGQSGTVHFSNGTMQGVRDFNVFNWICRSLLDVESSVRFMDEVSVLQKEGKLRYLLPRNSDQPNSQDVDKERVEQNRQAKVNQLEDQLQDLLLEERAVQAEGLNYYTLANVVASHMLSGLDNSELDPIFIEMNNRGMTIRIIVDKADDDDDEREVLQQIINPRNLISQDVSDKEDRLRRGYKQVIQELENIRK